MSNSGDRLAILGDELHPRPLYCDSEDVVVSVGGEFRQASS